LKIGGDDDTYGLILAQKPMLSPRKHQIRDYSEKNHAAFVGLSGLSVGIRRLPKERYGNTMIDLIKNKGNTIMSSLFKSTMLTVCFFLVVVSCVSCAANLNEPIEKPSTSIGESSSMFKEEIFQEEDVTEGSYWKIFSAADRYGYAIYDTTGHEFFRDLHPRGMFELRQLSETLIVMEFSGGNETSGVQYFDVEKRLFSPVYWNVLAMEHEKVAYLSTDRNWLIVHDVFETGRFFCCFNRPFFKYSVTQLTEELADQLVDPPFAMIQFLDKTHLHIRYLNEEMEFVEETVELSSPPSWETDSQ
jgi:hypothetical protein